METLAIHGEALSELIDDLLYFARIGDLKEVDIQLEQAAKRCKCLPLTFLMVAKDSETGNTILHMASANGQLDVVEYLLKINPQTLHWHIGIEPVGAATRLTEPSPLPNIPNLSGNTSVHYAAINGQIAVLKQLADAGADLQIRNKAGHEAIHEAELAEKPDVVNWLLDRMAPEATINDVNGNTMNDEDTVDEDTMDEGVTIEATATVNNGVTVKEQNSNE